MFETEGELQAHEQALFWVGRMEEFTASGLNPYGKGSQAGMVRKIVMAWEQFKSRNIAPGETATVNRST